MGGVLSPPIRESDRIFEELRAQLRSEALYGLVERGERPPTAPLALENRSSISLLLSTGRLEFAAISHRPFRPFRLCIVPAASETRWNVESVTIGCENVLINASPLPIDAFPPLPRWLSEPLPELPDDLREAIRAAPIENLRPIGMMPGVEARVSLLFVGNLAELDEHCARGTLAAIAPRAWLLGHVLREARARGDRS